LYNDNSNKSNAGNTNSKYGYGIYKKNQVSLGNPFAIQLQMEKTPPASSKEDREASDFMPVDSLERARREAELIIKEAQMEAERLLIGAHEAAKQDSEELRRKAREAGYAEGEKRAQNQYAALIAEAKETLDEARTEKSETFSGLEAEIISLVLDIAQKVVATELVQNRDAILSIIRSTLYDVTPSSEAVVKISFDDYDYVIENKDRLSETLSFLCELDIRKDNSLKKGSCVVDTSYGTAIGNADSRFKQIEDAFYALLVGRPEIPISSEPSETIEPVT